MQVVGDRSIAGLVKTLRARRGGGHELLAYRNGGSWRDIKSTEINDYIQETLGEGHSAKDFRTWNATVLAAVVLAASARERDLETKGAPRSGQARRRQAGRSLSRQHAGGLPGLLHRSARLRPLRRRASPSAGSSSACRRTPPTGPRCRGRSRRPCSTSSTGASPLRSSGGEPRRTRAGRGASRGGSDPDALFGGEAARASPAAPRPAWPVRWPPARPSGGTGGRPARGSRARPARHSAAGSCGARRGRPGSRRRRTQRRM